MLENVAKLEKISIDENSLKLIYQKSEGSARDAFQYLSKLFQVIQKKI